MLGTIPSESVPSSNSNCMSWMDVEVVLGGLDLDSPPTLFVLELLLEFASPLFLFCLRGVEGETPETGTVPAGDRTEEEEEERDGDEGTWLALDDLFGVLGEGSSLSTRGELNLISQGLKCGA